MIRSKENSPRPVKIDIFILMKHGSQKVKNANLMAIHIMDFTQIVGQGDSLDLLMKIVSQIT